MINEYSRTRGVWPPPPPLRIITLACQLVNAHGIILREHGRIGSHPFAVEMHCLPVALALAWLLSCLVAWLPLLALDTSRCHCVNLPACNGACRVVVVRKFLGLGFFDNWICVSFRCQLSSPACPLSMPTLTPLGKYFLQFFPFSCLT